MVSRLLFIFSLDDSARIPDKELTAAGWKLRRLSSAAEARVLAQKHTVGAGLMLLPKAGELSMETVEEILLVDECVNWIALVHHCCLQSQRVKKFVIDHFHDYHTHPIDPGRLHVTLGHAYGIAALKSELKLEESEITEQEIIGTSPAMQELRQNMLKMQGDDAPILITGESGTGKELVAKAIHLRSTRRHSPFVTVNCCAIPAALVQSELFGHEKGAFTGAFRRKIGKFESAAGGTIFLDEIGDLPLAMQASLLRFLQEKTIERVGSTRVLPVDVRVLAATNVELEDAVEKGLFREDLFYRLNVLRLQIPPLRARGDDIELLARIFSERFFQQFNKKKKPLSKQAVRAMHDHLWPGNVRELINRVRRAVVMAEGALMTAADLGLDTIGTNLEARSLGQTREIAELAAIRRSLQRNMNNVSEAARELGVSRVTLYRFINKFQIDRH